MWLSVGFWMPRLLVKPRPVTKYSVLPERPPYSKLGRYRAETAAVDADAAALLQRIAARGLDIDDAGGAQAELRR